jgi:CheY-like chemotaxis protein
MMGGSISLESEYGEGCVFNIIIPIVEGDESKVSRDSGLNKAQAISAPEAMILVVDDNEFNLKVAEGLLELFGIKAVLASSGKEAIGMIMNVNFDIVFMDHMMPDMDGLEATAEIRKLLSNRKENRKQLPIIALTANAVQGSREMFLEHGMDDFLSKPIEMAALARILSEWLPPEKIIIKHEEDAKEEDSSKEDGSKRDDRSEKDIFWEAIAKINEINTETGLTRVSGHKDMYRNNLKLFKERIEADNEKMELFLNRGDIKNFSITVHAIKSALASIGAEQLSGIALGLENASHDGDAEFCRQNFPAFSQRLTALHEALSMAVSTSGGETAEENKKGFNNATDAAAYLKENVQKALEAVDDFDTDAGIEALNNALACNYDGEVNTLMENAVRALKHYQYNEAKEILTKITF